MISLLCLLIITSVATNAAPGLDVKFGKMGIVTTDILGSDKASAVGVVYGKRIIAAGLTYSSVSNYDYALAGYRITDGHADYFGTGGKTVTAISNSIDLAEALAIQPDGKIVVAGSTQTGGITRAFSVARYSFAGQLDATFGTGGKAIIPVSTGLGGATALTLQPDGKILLAGYSDVHIHGEFATVRLTKTGVPDTSFGVNGIVKTTIGKFRSYAGAIVVQPDKKILVGGNFGDATGTTFAYTVVRYLSNGNLDSAFGSAGVVITPFGDNATNLRSIALQSTGRIVVGGLGRFSVGAKTFTMMGFKPSGQLDPLFGVQGVVNTPILNPSTPSLPLVIRPNDNIVVAGFSSPVFFGFGITGYSKNGVLLGSYGANVPISPYGDTAYAIALQPDGKVLVAGAVNFGNPGTGDDFAIARYIVNW